MAVIVRTVASLHSGKSVPTEVAHSSGKSISGGAPSTITIIPHQVGQATALSAVRTAATTSAKSVARASALPSATSGPAGVGVMLDFG